MTELIEMVVSWRSLLLALIVFGLAPGLILRLLVKIYPRDDPRRRELIAQLYTLGRVERLFFVAEQFETVLFEGLPHRLQAVRRRMKRRQATSKGPEVSALEESWREKQAAHERDTAVTLINALKNESTAMIQIASLLLVKNDGIVRTRTLSTAEMLELEKHPERSPEQVLLRMNDSSWKQWS